MRKEGLTDDVVHAACAGDSAALRLLYDALAGQVCGYLRARGVADPEDVTSEVFLDVLPRLPQLTGGASGLRKLVFSIAHARLVDDHRARARRPTLVMYDARSDTRSVESAEATAETSLGTDHVERVLDLLPDDQREVLLLRVVADLSLEQVADIIGRSVGAVKQLQRRGLITVRQALESGRVTL